MKKNPNKKVFTSSSADRGIFVKFSNDKQKISLSFWGNDAPKNISFTQEEALEFCDHITSVINKEENKNNNNVFESTFETMRKRLPERHFVK